MTNTFNAEAIAILTKKNLQQTMDPIFEFIQNSIVDYVESGGCENSIVFDYKSVLPNSIKSSQFDTSIKNWATEHGFKLSISNGSMHSSKAITISWDVQAEINGVTSEQSDGCVNVQYYPIDDYSPENECGHCHFYTEHNGRVCSEALREECQEHYG